MKEKKENPLMSEFQDFMRDNQRTDELRCASEEYFMLVIASGGHQHLYPLIHAIDAFFRQFEFICSGKEKKEMEDKYKKAVRLVDSELRRYNHLAMSGREPSTVPHNLIKMFREYLKRVYELRQQHGLAYRIRERKTSKELIDNAFGAF